MDATAVRGRIEWEGMAEGLCRGATGGEKAVALPAHKLGVGE